MGIYDSPIDYDSYDFTDSNYDVLLAEGDLEYYNDLFSNNFHEYYPTLLSTKLKRCHMAIAYLVKECKCTENLICRMYPKVGWYVFGYNKARQLGGFQRYTTLLPYGY